MITCRGSFNKNEHLEHVSAEISVGFSLPCWLYTFATPMLYPPAVIGGGGKGSGAIKTT